MTQPLILEREQTAPNGDFLDVEAHESIWAATAPDVNHLVTEDDTPVDNIFSAKQQRLLVEPLYSSWQSGRPFLADANVGIFRSVSIPPVVPDMFLSLDVEVAEDWYAKEHRSYFLWQFGKPPEVVIEVVSNTRGGEVGRKLREYALMGVSYYVIFDPLQLVQPETLRVYELRASKYIFRGDWHLEDVGLGLTLWEGSFESKPAQWLRWLDQEGKLIPTGAERAEQERTRAERLAAQLRALGVEPEA